MIQLVIQRRDIEKFAPHKTLGDFIELPKAPTQRNPERALFALNFPSTKELLELAQKLTPKGSFKRNLLYIGPLRIGEFSDVGTRQLDRNGELS